MQRACQLHWCIDIEEQAKKWHLLATEIVHVQVTLDWTSAVTTSRDTQHIAATRRQQSGTYFNLLLGSGNRVAILHNSRETSLCRTFPHTHKTTSRIKTWSDFKPRWTQSQLDILAFRQIEDCMQLNSNWKDIQTSTFTTKIQWGNTKV